MKFTTGQLMAMLLFIAGLTTLNLFLTAVIVGRVLDA